MKKGRETKGRGVSLHVDVSTAVDARIQELRPWVKGFSDYVQALIQQDLQKGTLGPVSEGRSRAGSSGEPQTPSDSEIQLSAASGMPMQCNARLRIVPDSRSVVCLPFGGGPSSSPTNASAAIPIAA